MSGTCLRPTGFVWRLEGCAGPPLGQALALGEAVRAAVMRAGNNIGLDRLPEQFHANHGGAPHQHAHWLSQDRDGDGRIDHVLIHAAVGLTGPVIAALASAERVWLPPVGEWSLVPLSLCSSLIGLSGPAWRWRTLTPYVTPLWHIGGNGKPRPGLGPEAQLRREIMARGLPAPSRIVCAAARAGADGGVVFATASRHPPKDAWRGQVCISFEEPVAGPLALGFGAHFGLGLLRPAWRRAPARPIVG